VGGVGTHIVQLARLVGAAPIIAVDINPAVRDRALELGARRKLEDAALLDVVVETLGRLEAVARDQAVAELLNIVRTLARTEVEAFCSVCQYREAALSMKAAKIAALA
jgi:Zn-dependent alcohol dehydrogenase